MEALQPLSAPRLPLRLRLRTWLPFSPAGDNRLSDEVEALSRDQIVAQLQLRDAFPHKLWEDEGIAPDVAKGICQLIADTFAWPNDFFMPQDRCAILIDGWRVRNESAQWTAIEERFYSPGGLHEFVGNLESLSLANFIHCLRRHRCVPEE